MAEKPEWMNEAEWLDTQSLQVFMEKWVDRFFGERCGTFDPRCECCRRWQLYDLLFSKTTQESDLWKVDQVAGEQ